MACKYDFHIHTRYLGCANQTMAIPAILRDCAQMGVTCLGIADHLNSLDKLPLHKLIRRDLERCRTAIDVFLGVELNFLECDGDFAFNAGVKEELGFQYAIGGIHSTYCNEYDLRKIIDIQHRHHIAACQSQFVDVLVHPYWFAKYEFDQRGWPWLDSVRAVPEAFARELGQVAKATETAIEINAEANLRNANNPADYVDGYADFLAAIAAEGAMFTVGSDAHDLAQLDDISAAWDMVERLGLPDDRIWRPKGKPFNRN